MPLSDDGRALLELLLAKGQSYGDIGSLLDMSEDEVRERARAALTELGGADPDRNVALTDWLLGQADPIGRADAARHVREDPGDHELAASLISDLRELAPEADFPRLPGEPSRGPLRRLQKRRGADAPASPGSPPKPRRGPSTLGLTSLSSGQSRLLMALASGGLILVVVVLAVAGVFSSGSDGGSDGASTASTTGTDTTTPGIDPNARTAEIPLEPVGGADASGSVTIGFTSGQQGFVELSADDLQPPPSGSVYYLWFMQDETTGYPYQPLEVTGSKATSQRFVLPNEALGVVLSARSLDVWLSPVKELQKRIPTALRDANVVEIPGERVLTAPVRKAVQAAQQAQAGG